MPGEFLLQADRDPVEAAAGYTQLTLAIDTRNLGRISIDFTVLRGQLAMKFEVQDTPVKQFVEKAFPQLRKRLLPTVNYPLSSLLVTEIGQGRSISVLLPKRRDLRRLSRAIGVL
jgi:hypothetical protein